MDIRELAKEVIIDKGGIAKSADFVAAGMRAVAQKGSVIGCQFHPEKSGKLGLSVIHRYLILCEAAH